MFVTDCGRIKLSELNFLKVSNYNKEIKKLYKEAFPKNERIPIFILKLLTRKNKADFFEIYDKEQFIGLVYNVYYHDIVFVFYLAVNNDLRGKGYGSKVLELIKDKYGKA